jgi:hypothetical protein
MHSAEAKKYPKNKIKSDVVSETKIQVSDFCSSGNALRPGTPSLHSRHVDKDLTSEGLPV